jgi:hypothetical protein
MTPEVYSLTFVPQKFKNFFLNILSEFHEIWTKNE